MSAPGSSSMITASARDPDGSWSMVMMPGCAASCSGVAAMPSLPVMYVAPCPAAGARCRLLPVASAAGDSGHAAAGSRLGWRLRGVERGLLRGGGVSSGLMRGGGLRLGVGEQGRQVRQQRRVDMDRGQGHVDEGVAGGGLRELGELGEVLLQLLLPGCDERLDVLLDGLDVLEDGGHGGGPFWWLLRIHYGCGVMVAGYLVPDAPDACDVLTAVADQFLEDRLAVHVSQPSFLPPAFPSHRRLRAGRVSPRCGRVAHPAAGCGGPGG